MSLAPIIRDTLSLIKIFQQKVKNENSRTKLISFNEVEMRDNQYVIHYTGEKGSNDFNGNKRNITLVLFDGEKL